MYSKLNKSIFLVVVIFVSFDLRVQGSGIYVKSITKRHLTSSIWLREIILFFFLVSIWFESSRVRYIRKMRFSSIFIQLEHPQGDDSNSPSLGVQWHFQLIPKAFLEKNYWHIIPFNLWNKKSLMLLWRFSRLSKHSINIQDGLQTRHYSYDRVPIPKSMLIDVAFIYNVRGFINDQKATLNS